jgi:hypothetical protein
MTPDRVIGVVVGLMFVVGAFMYGGAYDSAFAFNNRKPEYPPHLIARILLFVLGALALIGALTGKL